MRLLHFTLIAAFLGLSAPAAHALTAIYDPINFRVDVAVGTDEAAVFTIEGGNFKVNGVDPLVAGIPTPVPPAGIKLINVEDSGDGRQTVDYSALTQSSFPGMNETRTDLGPGDDVVLGWPAQDNVTFTGGDDAFVQGGGRSVITMRNEPGSLTLTGSSASSQVSWGMSGPANVDVSPTVGGFLISRDLGTTTFAAPDGQFSYVSFTTSDAVNFTASVAATSLPEIRLLASTGSVTFDGGASSSTFKFDIRYPADMPLAVGGSSAQDELRWGIISAGSEMTGAITRSGSAVDCNFQIGSPINLSMRGVEHFILNNESIRSTNLRADANLGLKSILFYYGTVGTSSLTLGVQDTPCALSVQTGFQSRNLEVILDVDGRSYVRSADSTTISGKATVNHSSLRLLRFINEAFGTSGWSTY